MKQGLPGLILLFLSSVPGCATPDLDEEKPFPHGGTYFYSGDENTAGELYLGLEEMRNEAEGKTVLLIPMIHGANTAFYDAVQAKLEKADLVLAEGVWGTGSLGPSYFVLTYLLHNSRRQLSAMGLTFQQEGLGNGAQVQNADLSKAEFQSATPWWTPVTHAVLLPVWVATLETMNLTMWLNGLGHGAVGEVSALEARRRHALVLNLVEDDGDKLLDRFVLPGVLTMRNTKVLAEFDRAAARPEVRRIAIPWGAAHMAGIIEGLQARGYKRSRHEWLPTLSVRRLLTGDGAGDEIPTNFRIPYLVHWRSFRDDWSLSTLFSLVEVGDGDNSFHLSFLWDLLFSLSSHGVEEELQVLPSLFGRPLIFEWIRRDRASRIRFLLFFEVGGLPGTDWREITPPGSE